MKSNLIAACSALVLAASVSSCATRGKSAQPETPAKSVSQDVPDRGLPAQRLLPGQCGLFLWTRGDNPAFVFFQEAGRDTAKALVAESAFDLQLVAANNSLVGEFFTEQTSRSAGDVEATITLTIEPG